MRSSDGRALLHEGPACLASIAPFLVNQAMREPYHRVAEVVRSGRTVLPGEGSVTMQPIPMSLHTIVMERA